VEAMDWNSIKDTYVVQVWRRMSPSLGFL